MVTGENNTWEVGGKKKKKETNEELCLHWVSIACQLMYLKVQHFRFETDHRHLSDSDRDSFTQVMEDLSLGPRAYETRTLTLNLFL